MALLEQIKDFLGLGSERSGGQPSGQGTEDSDDVAVTVEHEPDTETEDAVKGTGSEQTATVGEQSTTDDDEQAEGDADTPAETEADAPAESDDTTAGEPPQPEETGSSAESAPVETETSESEPATSASAEDVQSINGIGPAYAERLAEADVETVGDLVAADAEAVAETTGIALSRVEGWIDQASE